MQQLLSYASKIKLSTTLYALGILCSLTSFAAWFAYQQIHTVFHGASSYPFFYYLLTIYKVSVFLLILTLLCLYLLDLICHQTFSIKRMFFSIFPIVLINFGFSLGFCTFAIISISILLTLPYYKEIEKLLWQRKIDVLVLILIILWFTFYKNVNLFSPLQWARSLLNIRSEEIGVTAQIYKNYISSKQFSFSDMDYSNWAGVIHSPNGLVSPLLQIIALVFDLPSIDIKSFLKVILIILYALAIAGSFGFYLYFRYALMTRTSIAIMASLFFVLGNAFFLTTLQIEYFIFAVNYLLLPYVLLSLKLSIIRNSIRIACWTGAVIALPFFILSPHPEAIIYTVFIFMIFGAINLIAPKDQTRLNIVKLLGTSLLTFVIFSLFYTGPLLWEVLNGDMHVFGHVQPLNVLANVLPLIHKSILSPYFYLIILCFPCIVLQQASEKKFDPDPWAWLSIAFIFIFLNAFNVICDYLPFLNALKSIQIHFNLGTVMRPALFFALCGIVIFCIAANSMLTLVKSAIEIFNKLLQPLLSYKKTITVLSILLFCTAELNINLYSIQALLKLKLPLVSQNLPTIISQSTDDNPENCDYYIGLGAHLVNYSALANDAANLQFIKFHMLKFENDLSNMTANNAYKEQYFKLLNKSNYNGIKSIKNADDITSLASSNKMLIDRFYMDKQFNCVNPLLYISVRKRILHYNYDAMYANIPNRFMRIIAATNDENHLGLGSGLFINNATETFEHRYLIGYPLLQALYPIGWQLHPSLLIGVTTRKMANIAGVDIFTFKEAVNDAQRRNLKLLPYQLPSLVDPHYFVYRNLESYGMVYLANNINIVTSSMVKQQEATIRKYFHKQDISNDEFIKTQKNLQSMLLNLKNRYDIILESESLNLTIPPTNKIPTQHIKIHNIAGERAAMTANCQQNTCFLVYNIASLPGWHAFVNRVNVPIYRVNFAFMGIEIPSGISHIWFIYQSWASLLFYTISLFGFLFLLIISYKCLSKSTMSYKCTP